VRKNLQLLEKATIQIIIFDEKTGKRMKNAIILI